MGALVDEFGGRISGELIRAADWNGMLAKVEDSIAQLSASVEARLTPLEATVASLTPRVTALEASVAELQSFATTLRQGIRRVNLSTPTSTFAIGQRGLVSAAVTALDGTALDLGNAGARPWVDFVTGWGSLKAAPGFVAREGTGDQSISVQVNANGVASVLLRAEHAEAFAEDEELEVEAVMNTQVMIANQPLRVSEAILAGNTPDSETVRPAFHALTTAYQRTDSRVMQRYLDAYYVDRPSRTVGPFASTFNRRWRDYRATVLAFAKPDADPLTPDGSMGAASIQVTFRDWIAPWIVSDFLGDLDDLKQDFRIRIGPLVRNDLPLSMDGIFNEIDRGLVDGGLLGRQRQFRAAEAAVRTLQLQNPPAFFGELVDAVSNGIGVQRALTFSDAVTPHADVGQSAARTIAGSATKASAEAARLADTIGVRFDDAVTKATEKVRADVLVDQRTFQAELLREDGPIMGAQREAKDVRGALDSVNRALVAKADLQFVTDIVRQRG